MSISHDKLAERATITIEALPEHEDPANTFSYDTEQENREATEHVLALADRTIWGWCCVRVTATYGGISASDYLGSCSYESEKDFCSSGGYFDDMRGEALRSLADELEKIDRALVEIRA